MMQHHKNCQLTVDPECGFCDCGYSVIQALRAKVEVYKKGYDDQVALKDRHEAGYRETIAQLQAHLAAMTQERDRLKEAAESLPCIVCVDIMQAALRGETGGE